MTTTTRSRPEAPAAGAPWYRQPQQARSQETLDRLLAALDELLDERPFEEVTVLAIVERAERTVGSFYARFPDKYAALQALHARNLEHDVPFLERFLGPDRWAGTPLHEVVKRAVTLFVRAYRHPRSSFRPIMLRAATDEDVRRQCVEAAAAGAVHWRLLMSARASEISHPDPAAAADLSYRYLFAVLDHELLFGPAGPHSDLSDDVLIGEMTRSVLAVLGAAMPTEATP